MEALIPKFYVTKEMEQSIIGSLERRVMKFLVEAELPSYLTTIAVLFIELTCCIAFPAFMSGISFSLFYQYELMIVLC